MADLMRYPPERHYGFRCRNCSKSEFLGRRYSCWFCADYHVCGECYDANRLPEAPQHLYYHPLSVYYTYAEYQLYFGGEPFYGDHKVAQSYKCALCDERGLSTANLYKHLLQSHRTHRDHKAYLTLVNAIYLADSTMGQSLLQASGPTPSVRAPNSASARAPPGGNSSRNEQRPQQLFEAAFNLAMMVLQLDTMDSTASDFPDRCHEILQQSEALLVQHSNSRLPDIEAIESYVRVIEDQVVASMADRRRRLGGSSGSHRPVRFGAIGSASNAAPAIGMRAATPVLVDRQTAMPRRQTTRRTGEPLGMVLQSAVAAASGSGKAGSVVAKHRQVSTQVKTQGCQATKKIPAVIVSPLKDKRFLCAKLLGDEKAKGQKWETNSLKASFIEAIFCSMLADEELIRLPSGLPWPVNFLTVTQGMSNAVEPSGNLKPNGEVLLYPVKPVELMEKFYRGFANYKTWMGNQNVPAEMTADRRAIEGSVEGSSSPDLNDIPYADSGSDDLESGNSNQSVNEAVDASGAPEEKASELPVEENDEDLDGLEEEEESCEDENGDEGEEASGSEFSESAVMAGGLIDMVMQEE
ncbi:uncharacterized protein LOC26534493 [Drosophila yakuba]|uniref:ZZ-type domain-containing protein n=1 Tax=Drosophila yakuba TaxID=7245 RepID=A0A0R1DJM2_DROYA|nr:uncharacterized protein LOC26534493 [Drosophila yakuba]KRJ97493.1 uncharacterized protein Dyak_GE27312 [Drosophila yakuba]